MDAWAINSGASVLNNASSIISAASVFANDPYFLKVAASQKSLILDNKEAIGKFLLAASKDDVDTLRAVVRSVDDVPALVNDTKSTGISPLIYAIFFNHVPVVEFLLENGANPDLPDTSLATYTPIMWAVYLNQVALVQILLNHQADPYLSPGGLGSKKNAVTLVYPENNEMYEYFKSHNIFRPEDVDGGDSGDFYQSFDTPDDNMDDLATQIKLQTITADTIYDNDDRDPEEREREKVALYVEERTLAEDPVLLALPVFDYTKLLPDQYIKFSDSDIPSLLDYIFLLRTTKTGPIQHETKVPAAIVFQLLRYAHMKAESTDLTEFLFDCFIARLRSVTNTKSGVFTGEVINNTQDNKDGDSGSANGGDIVLLSYWLSVIQFLHFYLSKNNLYKSYPKFLQELINTVQSLIATMSFSVNTRLNLLVDECVLDFTNLVDVSNALYAKDWNLFKTKKKHPSSYDDILNMLYPPSERELMKPSPIRFVQVLGALDYVLKLHQVDSLFYLETFSQVFYYINCTIFNRIISQLRYCTRGKAIQIRLNISTIEDWLRGHNYAVSVPEKMGGLEQLLPEKATLLNTLQVPKKTAVAVATSAIKSAATSISAVFKSKTSNNPPAPASSKAVSSDPHFLPFYYTSLFHIGKTHLQPSLELLQFLQCMSRISNEDELVATINEFDSLNYFQILKTINKLYKYEVDEPKIPKPVINFMKKLQAERGEIQVSASKLHYMTQTNFLLKEVYVYLNPNFVFPVALPNLQELINDYGAGIGGVRVYRAKKFQPSLPITVQDDVDELLIRNKEDQDRTYENPVEDEVEDEEDDRENDNDDANEIGGQSSYSGHTGDILSSPTKQENIFKGDQLFKEVQLPSSLAHKNWGDDDIDVNPW